MTALNLYGSNVSATKLTSAGKLNTALGGTSVTVTTKIGTSSSVYIEMWALGTTTITTFASIQTPTGNGWLLDATTLESNQINSGTWTPSVQLRAGSGNVTCDVYMR